MDKVLEKLYCTHHHTLADHPACFAQGKILDKVAKKFEQFTGEPWYKYPGYRIGYLDIEVDNLKADYGCMLTWALKEKDGEVFTGKITQFEMFNGELDKRIVEELVKKMAEFSILVGYFSSGFDIPYIRTRALINDVKFLAYGSPYHFDLYYTIRHQFALSRNSLGRAVELLVKDDNKTHCSAQTWAKAKYGDREALDEILKYNIQDVVVTEKLHNKIAPFRKWTRKSI